MEIPVKIQVFEGPLDLLLHLIEINKLDIYDIPISEITDQYLDHISRMPFLDMDSASEFLVMAAVLLRIKSKEMLPVETEDEETDEIDEKTELQNRLFEYKMYKYAASLLREENETAGNRVYKDKDIPKDLKIEHPPIDYEELLSGISMSDLKMIFQEALKRQENKIDPIRSKYGKVYREKITVSQAITGIRSRIKRKKDLSFRSLLSENRDRVSIIVTFLAVLEMTRNNEIIIKQDHLFDDIIISSGGDKIGIKQA